MAVHILAAVQPADIDPALGVAFIAQLKESGWENVATVPTAYIKTFDGEITEAEKHAEEDLTAAAVEAEVDKVPYILLVSHTKPVTGVAEGE
jgi:hypothetical protein